MCSSDLLSELSQEGEGGMEGETERFEKEGGLRKMCAVRVLFLCLISRKLKSSPACGKLV